MSYRHKPLWVVDGRTLGDALMHELEEFLPTASRLMAQQRAEWYKRVQIEKHGNGARLDIDAQIRRI
jgi:hypothetical protein